MTFEMWIKPDVSLISRELGSLGGIYKFGTNAAGWVYFKAGSGWAESSSALLTVGKAHHLVGTYDGTTAKLYVDGKQQGFASPSKGSVENATSLSMYLIDGMVDETRVYNKALSLTEINEDATMPVTASKSALSNGTKLPLVTTTYDEATGRPVKVSTTESGVTRTLTTEY